MLPPGPLTPPSKVTGKGGGPAREDFYNDPKSWQLIMSLIRQWELSLRDVAKEAP